jgi:hypothetical protein
MAMARRKGYLAARHSHRANVRIEKAEDARSGKKALGLFYFSLIALFIRGSGIYARDFGVFAHLDCAVEDGAFFDNQGGGYHIAVESACFMNFHFAAGLQITVDCAVYDAGADVNLAFDFAGFANNQRALFGIELAVYFAVNLQPVLENYVAYDFYAFAYPAKISATAALIFYQFHLIRSKHAHNRLSRYRHCPQTP